MSFLKKIAQEAVGPFIGGLFGLNSTKQANAFSQEQFNTLTHLNKKQFAQSLNTSKRQFSKNLAFSRRQAQTQRSQFNRSLEANRRAAVLDRAAQKQFAQQSTGWAFNDLMEAADQSGIHRLAALGGAGGASYSPTSVGSPQPVGVGGPSPTGTPGANPAGTTPIFQEDQSFIGDAIGAALNADRNSTFRQLETENAELQNELLRAEIRELDAQTSRTQMKTARNAVQNIDHYDPATWRTTRADEAKITKGPHKGKYLVMSGGRTYIVAEQNSPTELQEALLGDVVKEYSGLHEVQNVLTSGNEAVRKDGVWVKKSEHPDYARPKKRSWKAKIGDKRNPDDGPFFGG